MGAISAFRTTGGALSRNPVVFAGAFIFALVVILIGTTVSVIQFLSFPLVVLLASLLALVVLVFVIPFLRGGLLGMATEGVAGETSLGTFIRAGKDRYVSLLFASLLFIALEIALAVAYFILFGIVGVVVGAASGGGEPGLVLTVAVLVLLLVFLFIFFLIQFFSVAVVVDEVGAIEGFVQSYRLVRRNLLSTVGYNLLSFLLTLVIAIPLAIVFFIVFALIVGVSLNVPETTPTPTTPNPFSSVEPGFFAAILVVYVVACLAIRTPIKAITRTYAVSFYRDRRVPGRDESEPQNTQGPNQQPGD